MRSRSRRPQGPVCNYLTGVVESGPSGALSAAGANGVAVNADGHGGKRFHVTGTLPHQQCGVEACGADRQAHPDAELRQLAGRLRRGSRLRPRGGPGGQRLHFRVSNSLSPASGTDLPFDLLNPWGPEGAICGGGDTGRAFVTKMNPTRTALIFSTYIGGFAGYHRAHNIVCPIPDGCGGDPRYARGWDVGWAAARERPYCVAYDTNGRDKLAEDHPRLDHRLLHGVSARQERAAGLPREQHSVEHRHPCQIRVRPCVRAQPHLPTSSI